MSEPISPQDVAGLKEEAIPEIPDVVIDTFNDLIIRKFSGTSARVTQPEIIDALENQGIKRWEIFNKDWLDVEEIYEKRGLGGHLRKANGLGRRNRPRLLYLQSG